MASKKQCSTRRSAAVLSPKRQVPDHGSGWCHNHADLTPHGRRFGVGRVISPAQCCDDLLHPTIGVTGEAFADAPKTGGTSHNWLAGNRASSREPLTPGRPATTGSTWSPDRGASLTARARLTIRTQAEARCDQAAASPVAFHSVFGETASTPHRGGRRRVRRGLFHCGVRELASLASVRAGGLRGVVGALSRGLVVVGLRPGHSRDRDGSGYGAATGLHPAAAAQKGRGGFDSRARVTSHNGGDRRAKRLNVPNLRAQRVMTLLPERGRVAATFYSEAMQ